MVLNTRCGLLKTTSVTGLLVYLYIVYYLMLSIFTGFILFHFVLDFASKYPLNCKHVFKLLSFTRLTHKVVKYNTEFPILFIQFPQMLTYYMNHKLKFDIGTVKYYLLTNFIWLLSILTNMNRFSVSESNPGSHIAFSYVFSIFLRLSWLGYLWRVVISYFVDCPLICTCPIFLMTRFR